MPKRLPPQTAHALNPPAGDSFPYAFFENVSEHSFQPADTALNLRNAWWLMDAAFLSYSNDATIKQEFHNVGGAAVQPFSGKHSTQCYVASTDDWIVLAFRDWTTDARFVPVLDAHGDWVHAGFKSAVDEVWRDVTGHIRALQTTKRRPFWICGHSLGAALATVAANLCSADQALGFTGLYTFGSPRVGDRRFGGRIAPTSVFRFQNDSDVVSHVPLGLVFHHVGGLQFIDGGGHLHQHVTGRAQLLLRAGALLSPVAAHSVSGLLHDGDDLPLPGFLADHAPINYAILLWNCYEASR
jgi:triacylglycerol lipase